MRISSSTDFPESVSICAEPIIACEKSRSEAPSSMPTDAAKSRKPLANRYRHAGWCGPCRMLAPTVDAVETEYAGRVVVAKCNVDDADEASMQFRIRNIPTLLFFKGGEMVNRLVGAVSKQEITAILDSLI